MTTWSAAASVRFDVDAHLGSAEELDLCAIPGDGSWCPAPSCPTVGEAGNPGTNSRRSH